jgi:DNA-binding GntR family transcriptional regulator
LNVFIILGYDLAIMDMENFNSTQITVADMAPHVHTFLSGENKVKKLFEWLTSWIEISLECGSIKPYDRLPSKADLACHIGVSQGTIQNVYRLVEDAGYIESKQRLGSYIRNKNKSESFEKLTSKREYAIELLKKYICENNFKAGDALLTTRKLAVILGISNTTLSMAISNLVTQGILLKKDKSFVVVDTSYKSKAVEMKTLVEKVADKLLLYINENLSSGDKLPSNSRLTVMFDVSVKTIHDAIKLLTKEGYVLSRRGNYGTIVLSKNNTEASEMYYYEKIEQKIKHFIEQNSAIGDKLPTIKEFSKQFGTSEKTIKKAIDNLVDEGYVMCTRGRYGGTFVTDIPQSGTDAYKWLAIDSNYVASIDN